MTDDFKYPKRGIISEPFVNQIDVIEKTLIEVQNQPSSLYTNNNQKRKNHFNAKFSNVLNVPISDFHHDSSKRVPPSTLTNTSSSIGSTLATKLSYSTTPVQQQQSLADNASNSFKFDPFKPVDFMNDSKLNYQQIFSSSTNSILGNFNSNTATTNIWGNNNNQRLSNGTTVWG